MSESKSKRRSRSKSPSRSKSRSRSPDRKRRRSRSPDRDRKRQKSRSRSPRRRSNERRDRKRGREQDDGDTRSAKRSRRDSRERDSKELNNDKDRKESSEAKDRDKRPTSSERDEKSSAGGETNKTTVSSTEGKVPEDLEAIVRQASAVEAEQLKPKFMTKAERRAAAIKRREEQVAGMRATHETERVQRQQMLTQSGTRDLREEIENRRADRIRDSRSIVNDERRKDSRERRDTDKKRKRDEDSDVEDDVKASLGEKEKEAIKMQKMGMNLRKKRYVKPSEKFRFNFEWDLGEDTSKDFNPLYSRKIEARPLFGRGYIAGVDKKEQLKKYREIVKQAKESAATRELASDEKANLEKVQREIELLEQGEVEVHWSKKNLEDMTTRDWRIVREDFNITTKGGSIPNPIRNWDDCELPLWLMSGIREAGYERPSPVQMQAIPLGLGGRDILGVAETGSGKTAAFVFPMLVYISKLPKMTRELESEGPYAVILAPTRELATQIQEETDRFAHFGGYRSVLLVGGQPIEEQAQRLRNGAEIIIATPGRLCDCLQNSYIVLNQCNFVVLDEADRMVDMGFEPQVIAVLEAMPKDHLKSEDELLAAQQEQDHRNQFRTTLMFSATMPTEVERLAKRYLRRPATIYIGVVGRAVERIQQVVVPIKSEHEKKQKLEQLLRDGPPPPIIIFVNQRKLCDSLTKWLGKLGYKAASLQGGRSQEQREWALQEFKEGNYDVLVATDVAGRGLDVKGVTHVINYDLPKEIDTYTHRIGRTARAGEYGLATSFMWIGAEDGEILYDLKKMLLDTSNPVPHELASHPDAQVKPAAAATAPQAPGAAARRPGSNNAMLANM